MNPAACRAAVLPTVLPAPAREVAPACTPNGPAFATLMAVALTDPKGEPLPAAGARAGTGSAPMAGRDHSEGCAGGPTECFAVEQPCAHASTAPAECVQAAAAPDMHLLARPQPTLGHPRQPHADASAKGVRQSEDVHVTEQASAMVLGLSASAAASAPNALAELESTREKTEELQREDVSAPAFPSVPPGVPEAAPQFAPAPVSHNPEFTRTSSGIRPSTVKPSVSPPSPVPSRQGEAVAAAQPASLTPPLMFDASKAQVGLDDPAASNRFADASSAASGCPNGAPLLGNGVTGSPGRGGNLPQAGPAARLDASELPWTGGESLPAWLQGDVPMPTSPQFDGGADGLTRESNQPGDPVTWRVPSAAEVDHLPVSERETRNLPAEGLRILAGTGTAERDSDMNKSTEGKHFAGQAPQNLPGAGGGPEVISAGRREVHLGPVPVENDAERAQLLPVWMPGTPGDRVVEPGGMQAPVMDSRALAPMDALPASVLRQVTELRRTGATEMSVVIQPDPETQLSLRLSLGSGGEVVVQARCEQGDAQALAANWSEIRHSLAQQGVRLGALEFSPGRGHEAFQPNAGNGGPSPDGQPSSQRHGQPWPETLDDLPLTGSLTEPLVRRGVQRPPAGRARLLESWA